MAGDRSAFSKYADLGVFSQFGARSAKEEVLESPGGLVKMFTEQHPQASLIQREGCVAVGREDTG